MRCPAAHMLLLACSCYLLSQVTGLHLHVSADPEHGVPHVVHLEPSNPEQGDHSTDVDVSLFDIGTNWGKLAVPLLISSLMLLALVLAFRCIVSPPGSPRSCSSRLHFRPQLRAPPVIV